MPTSLAIADRSPYECASVAARGRWQIAVLALQNQAPRTDGAPTKMIERWDSRDVPAKDRLEGYLHRVEKTLFVSSLTPINRDGFRASIDEVRFDHGRAARFVSTPHLVSRLKREVDKTSEDTLVAGLHLSGGVRVKVKDITVDRACGDMVAIESATQFTLETSPATNFSMLSLFFEGPRIDALVGRSHRQIWKLLGSQPAASTLHACIRLFGRRFAEQAAHEELSALFTACEAMVAAALLEDRDLVQAAGDAKEAVKTGLLLTILDYTESNIREPTLSPGRVAAAFGISTRYLHKLFEDKGVTFSTFVLNRRLDGVHHALSVPSRSHVSITDIAQQWGLLNRAAFHRNFKRRFQMTPKQSRGTAGLG